MTERMLRRPAVEARTGLSRSTLYAMMAEGRFPLPVKLGLRAVGAPGSRVCRQGRAASGISPGDAQHDGSGLRASHGLWA